MATAHIPVIDISKPDDHVGDHLVDAVHKWGFAFVRGDNTGFIGPFVDHMFALVSSHNHEAATWLFACYTDD